MWYGDKREAKVNIMWGLKERGWKVYGYDPDQSDSMTDYYHPASWDGVAEKNGYVLLVDMSSYGLSYSGKTVTEQTINVDWSRIQKLEALRDDSAASEGEKVNCQSQIDKIFAKAENSKVVKEQYPTFKHTNPGRCNWHLERDGMIIDKGNGAFTCLESNDHIPENKAKLDAKVNKFIDRIEQAMTAGDQLKAEVKQVTKKVIKPVDVEPVEPADFKKDVTCIKMLVDFTHGLYKGKILTFKRVYNGTNNSYVFVKMGKRMKALTEKAENMLWLDDAKIKRYLEKGYISFCELREVEEMEEATVFKKVEREEQAEEETQNNNDTISITGEVSEEQAQKEHTEENEDFEPATQKQLFALHMASKRTIDTRGINISKQKASELIGRSKAGEDITEELKVIKEGKKEERKQNNNVVDFETFKQSKEQTTEQDEQGEEVETMEAFEQATAQTKPFIKGIAFNYGVWAYQRGVNRVPAQDQKFLIDILSGVEVGEPSTIKYMDEWLEGWDNENLKSEEQAESNNTESITDDTFIMDDILGVFDNIEIENNNRIDKEDLEFCQEQEDIYNKLLSVHLNIIEQLKAIEGIDKEHGEKFGYSSGGYFHKQNTAYEYSLKVGEVKETIKKMKGKFISAIVYHFKHKYNVTLEAYFNRDYDEHVTYEDILDEIFEQMGGFNFTEKAVNELKEKSKEAVKHRNSTIKSAKLIIDGYFAYKDSIWNEYRLRGDYKNIFDALQHFDNGSIDGNKELNNKYCGWENEKNQYNYDKYEVNTLTKVKSIKFLKNGKLEIEFTSNQLAHKFAAEYCGISNVA